MLCVTEDEGLVDVDAVLLLIHATEALKLALEVVQEDIGPVWTPGELLNYADEVQTHLDSLTARLIEANTTR